MSRRRVDLSGQTFGKLWVSFPAGWWDKRGYFYCVCECGQLRIVRSNALTTGNTISCGCSPGSFKHGGARDSGVRPGYYTWCNMRARCNRPQRAEYRNYGGRGITVCDRWQGVKGYQNFLADMGEKPPNYSLDRINNDGNYEPSNCRWATYKEQTKNRRKIAMLVDFSTEELQAELVRRTSTYDN